MNTVAIIGRPNVGKSTVFNMLVGKRLAITHQDAGVTRDIKNAKVDFQDHQIEFLDTGGITDEGVFAEQIKQLSYKALDSADVAMLIVSAEELTAEDEELIFFVRKLNMPVLLVVNKADNESREWTSAEYYKFGIGDPIMISALHRRNIDYLWDAIITSLGFKNDHTLSQELAIKSSKTNLDEYLDNEDIANEDDSESMDFLDTQPPEYIRLIIMGKPNTGKSSLLNAFLGKERTLVSDIPGTTRDIIEEEAEVLGEKFVLVDSAGIRRKNRIYEDVEYYASHRAISAIESSDVVLLLIDVIEGFSEQDKKLASLILRKGKGLVIGLNKWDAIEVKENRLVAEKDRLSYLVPQLHFVSVCPLSAKNHSGFSHLIKEVKNVFQQLYTKINTSMLNKDLEHWVSKTQPPLVKRRRGKMKFIAQSSVNPIVFKARVNNPSFFTEAYKQYIINNIRSTYQIKNIPIQLDLVFN